MRIQSGFLPVGLSLQSWSVVFLLCVTTAVLVLSTHPSTGHAQEPEPITLGLAKTEPGTQFTMRSLNFRPAKEESNKSDRFVPSATQLVDRDGAPIFLRMNWEATNRLQMLRAISNNDYDEFPLEKLKTHEIRALMCIQRSEMKRFVLSKRAGWQYPFEEHSWVDILLPDVQESRIYARAMTAYARASIVEGDIAQAEEWIFNTIGMSRQIAETPLTVTRLVSSATLGIALDTIEELIQHPDAGNYYWDLTSIRRPIVDRLETAQFEASFWTQSVPELAHLDKPRSNEDWASIVNQLFKVVQVAGEGLPDRASPEGTKMWKEWVAIAREKMHRVAPDLVGRMKSMGDDEIGVHYLMKRLEQIDRFDNTAALEPHFAIPRSNALIGELRTELVDEPFLRKSLVLGMSTYASQHFISVEQRVDMLRVIESLRDWSANHEGRLPETLDELDLPVPLDIVTHQPFVWVLDGSGHSGALMGAVIETEILEGEPQRRGRRYEVVVPE